MERLALPLFGLALALWVGCEAAAFIADAFTATAAQFPGR